MLQFDEYKVKLNNLAPTLEELGLLKMDFLGLRNLTVLDDAAKLKSIKPPFGTSGRCGLRSWISFPARSRCAAPNRACFEARGRAL